MTTTKPQPSPLQPGSLYILLYLRSDPPKPDDYHWALYLHSFDPSNEKNRSSGRGYKFHISNLASSNGLWTSDHGPASNIMGAMFLVGLFRVGIIEGMGGDEEEEDEERRNEAEREAHRIITKFDEKLNEMEKGLTCRTWIWMVMEELLLLRGEEGAGGKKKYGSLKIEGGEKEEQDGELNMEALERQVLDFGNRFAGEACLAVMPRPVGGARGRAVI